VEATGGGGYCGHVGIISLLSFWGVGAWRLVASGRTEGLPLLLHGLKPVPDPIRQHLVSLGSGISRPSTPWHPKGFLPRAYLVVLESEHVLEVTAVFRTPELQQPKLRVLRLGIDLVWEAVGSAPSALWVGLTT